MFRSLYRHGFARVAACTARCTLADPAANAAAILRLTEICSADGVALAVFPELSVSGYAIDDLLLSDAVQHATEQALLTLIARSAELLPVLVVGAPLRHGARLYNCAVAIHRGRLLGVVPKVHLPNYREFYEKRHFAPGDGTAGQSITIGPHKAPFGPDLLFSAEDLPGLTIHAGDLRGRLGADAAQRRSARWPGRRCWPTCRPATSPSARRTCAGCCAQSQSARCLAAYLYAAAGTGEFDHRPGLGRPGLDLRERRDPRRDASASRPSAQHAVADVDLDLLRQERLRMGSFDDNRRLHADAAAAFRQVTFRLEPPRIDLGLQRPRRALPVRPRRPEGGSSRTATRPTTSRSPA